MSIKKERKHVFPPHLQGATFTLFTSALCIRLHTCCSTTSAHLNAPLEWQVCYLRTCHSNLQLVSAMETLQEFFFSTFTVYLFVFLKHKWLIRQYFCCLFKETYSKKREKNVVCESTKIVGSSSTSESDGKRTGGCHPKYMPVSYTNMAAIHVGWQHKYVVAKVCFVYLGHVLTLGRKKPPKQ